MAKTISVTYTLHVADTLSRAESDAAAQAAAPSGSRAFPVPAPAPAAPSTASPTSAYYAALSPALLAAQRSLNESLTVYKDAIGERERAKEDRGRVAPGMGKVARMMAAVKAVDSGASTPVEDDESEEENGVELEEV